MNEHMEEARADLADCQAQRRAEIAGNAGRDIPVEVAEILTGIRAELRGIRTALWVLATVAVITSFMVFAG